MGRISTNERLFFGGVGGAVGSARNCDNCVLIVQENNYKYLFTYDYLCVKIIFS